MLVGNTTMRSSAHNKNLPKTSGDLPQNQIQLELGPTFRNLKRLQSIQCSISWSSYAWTYLHCVEKLNFASKAQSFLIHSKRRLPWFRWNHFAYTWLLGHWSNAIDIFKRVLKFFHSWIKYWTVRTYEAFFCWIIWVPDRCSIISLHHSRSNGGEFTFFGFLDINLTCMGQCQSRIASVHVDSKCVARDEHFINAILCWPYFNPQIHVLFS